MGWLRCHQLGFLNSPNHWNLSILQIIGSPFNLLINGGYIMYKLLNKTSLLVIFNDKFIN